MTAKEQYEIQYNDIKKKHKQIKKKKIMKLIAGAIICFIISFIVYVIKKDEVIMTLLQVGSFAFIVMSIKTAITKTPQERRELNYLNNAYTQERFKERNG